MLIGLATTVGYILGPLIGGVLSDNNLVSWFSFYLPFCFAALLTFLALVFASLFLSQSSKSTPSHHFSFTNELNLFKRIKNLKQNTLLLQTLLVMLFLSLAVDAYYEFYPVYLVGKWQITSAGIALFTISLAIAVGLGDFFLVPYLSRHLKDRTTVIYSSLVLTVFIGLILFTHQPHDLYFFFFIIGLAIAASTTTLVVMVSNVANKNTQGKAMGLALSFRTLGDSIISLIGGLLIAISFNIPILLSATFALTALLLQLRLRPSRNQKIFNL